MDIQINIKLILMLEAPIRQKIEKPTIPKETEKNTYQADWILNRSIFRKSKITKKGECDNYGILH